MGILALLSGLFAQLFSNGVAYFIGVKVVLFTLFVTVLPIVLNNVFKKILDGIFSLISSQVGSVSPLASTFSGFAGWLLAVIEIPACFSILFAAIAFKVMLRCIPFVRL